MSRYLYEALDKGGKTVKGIIESINEETIIDKLKSMGYYPLRVVSHREKAEALDISALPIIRIFAHRIKLIHVVTFTRQFATLLDAGVPILRSLNIIYEQIDSVIFKEKISVITKDIESGSTLSEALAKHPKVFDKLYINMVRAGEIGGVLENVLNKIADILEKRQALINKIRSALAYPTVVLLIAATIVTFILIKIIPVFQNIFSQMSIELPYLTRMLVHASDVLLHKTIYLVIGGIVIYFLISKANKTKEGKFIFDTIKLKLPVFGNIFRKAAIVRFAGTLSTLITSGVPILQSLDIVRESSGNEVISKALVQVYNSVKDGETINEPLSKCPVFPTLVVQMIAIGEETGSIDFMLNKVSEAYERDVDNSVNSLASIIEPILLVFLGVIIGTIVVALYLPLIMLPIEIGRNN